MVLKWARMVFLSFLAIAAKANHFVSIYTKIKAVNLLQKLIFDLIRHDKDAEAHVFLL